MKGEKQNKILNTTKISIANIEKKINKKKLKLPSHFQCLNFHSHHFLEIIS